MNIIQWLENLFKAKPATPTVPATPSQFQGAVNIVGQVFDTFENGLNTLQSAAAFLPPAFQGYIAAIAVAVHAGDSFVDTLETPAAPSPAPATTPVTPPTGTPAAPGATPTANL